MAERNERRAPARQALDMLDVPFLEVVAGSVFVVGMAAYLKLAVDDRLADLRCNSVDLGTGRLHFFAADFCVAWAGATAP